jgi:hypothetical protein
MPGPVYLPARVNIAIYKASYDGQYWGKYPNGDKPGPGMFAGASASSSATGALSTRIQLATAAQIKAAATGALTTGGGSGKRTYAFAPGIYTTSPPNMTQSLALSLISSISGTKIRGIEFFPTSGSYDTGTSGPNYSSGDAMMESVLNAAQSAGKYVEVGFPTQGYGNSVPSQPAGFPPWMTTAGTAGNNFVTIVNPPGTGLIVCSFRLDITAAYNAWLGMWTHFFSMWGNHPALVLATPVGETGFAFGSVSGMNYTNYINNLAALHAALSLVAPRTPLRCQLNNTGSATQSLQLLASNAAIPGGGQNVGGPDPMCRADGTTGAPPFPGNVGAQIAIQGWELYNGQDNEGDIVGPVYINTGPFGFVASVQSDGNTGSYASNTPASLNTIAQRLVKPYMYVMLAGGGPNFSLADIIAYAATNPTMGPAPNDGNNWPLLP